MLIIIGIIVTIFSNHAYANGNLYEGDVFSNYPENENWTVEDINIDRATLIIDKLDVNGLNLQFNGTVQYKNRDYKFKKMARY